MANQKDSWFVRARRFMSVVGITVNGILHKAVPVRQCPKCGEVWTDGLCPNNGCKATAPWRQTPCQKKGCGSISAVVFRSTTDKFGYFIFCQKCGKYDYVQGVPPKVDRNALYKKAPKASAEGCPVGPEENVPPPVGSLEKPKTVKASKAAKAAKK